METQSHSLMAPKATFMALLANWTSSFFLLSAATTLLSHLILPTLSSEIPMRSIFFSTDLFLRLTNRCCWSWDKILPSFVSDKGGLRPWAPLRVSILTNSSKRGFDLATFGVRLLAMEPEKVVSNQQSQIIHLITDHSLKQVTTDHRMITASVYVQ